MKVLFVYPATDTIGLSHDVVMLEPLSLEYLAASVSQQHEVKIIDLRLDRNLKEMITDWKPDVVGITGFTFHSPEMISLAQEVKVVSQDIKVLLGGHHATFSPESFMLPTVDAIVRGPGEGIIDDILSSIQSYSALSRIPGLLYRDDNKWLSNPGWPIFHDENMPRHSLINASHYHALGVNCSAIFATRGCPNKCNFCDASKFYQGKYKIRDVESIIEEIQSLPAKLIVMVDDNIGINSNFLRKLVYRLDEANLRRKYITTIGAKEVLANMKLLDKWFDIGLRGLFIGIERVDSEELASLGKKVTRSMNDTAISFIHSRGGIIIGNFIVLPTDTKDDFDRLEEYIKSRGIDIPGISVLTPLPGTELWNEYKGRLSQDFRKYDLVHAVVPTTLPSDDFDRYFHHLYTSLNGRRLVWKMVRNIGLGNWLFRLPRIYSSIKRLRNE